MSHKSFIKTWSLVFVILCGAALFLYTNYRAANLSITHDEGVIYQIINNNSAWQIFNYVIPQDHMINSLLMKFSCQIFPDSEYTLRLPNLIGHLLYLIFSILLLIRLKNPHLLVTGFILLNCNPYLLDFFSIARGYGLTVSFMMVSLYYGFSYIQYRRIISLFYSFLFAVLSVLTVYTLLNYFIALCLVVLLMLLIWWGYLDFKMSKKYRSFAVYSLIIVTACVVLLFIQLLEPLERVQSEQFIQQAFRTNFYEGTIRPIVFRSIYNSDPKTTVNIVSFGLVGIYLIAFLTLSLMAARKNFSFTGRLLFFSFFLSFIVFLSIYLQNELFNTRFVSNRTATFIVPLMVLTIIGMADEFMPLKKFKIPALIFVYAIAALFLINTLKHANFKSYLDWQYDVSTREMMNDLCEDVESMRDKQVKFGIVWLYEPSINFYRVAWDLDWLEKVDRKGYNGDFDYFYVNNVDSVLQKENIKNKIKIRSYKDSGMILLKKDRSNGEGSN